MFGAGSFVHGIGGQAACRQGVIEGRKAEGPGRHRLPLGLARVERCGPPLQPRDPAAQLGKIGGGFAGNGLGAGQRHGT